MVVVEEDEVGDIEEMREEWHEGVLSVVRPAERATWRRGTDGRARRLLWVCMKRLARVVHRDSL